MNVADKRAQLEELLRQAERSRGGPGAAASAAAGANETTSAAPLPPVAGALAPMAIIGLAGRYPGADSLDEFWSNLIGRWNCIEELRGDRLEDHLRGVPPAEREAALRVRHFGLLRDIYRFDAPFFALSRREAEVMDPHMRLLIEAAWSCVENAGYRPRALGGRTGVFVSFYNHEYAEMLRDLEIEPASEAYLGTATTGAIFANRISYLLGLTGPSEVYNTACSTALVALHRAMQSIRGGECEQAIIAGASLLLTPGRVLALGKMGILNERGVCNPYSHPANKEAIGEGVGALLVKPLERALADGDYVYCIVHGSDVGHAGARSGGLTLPSADALAELMTTTYRRLGPNAVAALRYIEGHGAGGETDVIELRALQGFLAGAGIAASRPEGRIPVGSVKSNIGFGEASGGIAQLTKCALALQAGEIPATLHFQQTDPVFDYENAVLRIAAENVPLDRAAADACVSVLAYGLGGTNAHVVLGNHRGAIGRTGASAAPRLVPLLFSAGNDADLTAYVRQIGVHLTSGAMSRRYRELFAAESDLLQAVARTLAGRERDQRCRVVLLVANLSDVLAAGEAFATQRPDRRILRETEPGSELMGGEDAAIRSAREWVQGQGGLAAACFAPGPYQKLPLPPVLFRGEVHRLRAKAQSTATASRGVEDRWVVTREAGATIAEIVLTPEDCLMAQHRVDGHAVLPGVAYIALLTSLSGKLHGGERCTIENLAWTMPFVVAQGSATLRCEVNAAGRFRISHRELGRLCCTGRLIAVGSPGGEPAARVRAAEIGATRPLVDGAAYWNAANAPETRQWHGPDLRSLTAIHAVGEVMVAVLEPRASVADLLATVAVYDSALGACRGFALAAAAPAQPVVPFAVEQVQVRRSLAAGQRFYAAVTQRTEALTRYDISIEDGAGTVFAVLTGYYAKAFASLPVAGSRPQWEGPRPKEAAPVAVRAPEVSRSGAGADLRELLLRDLRAQFAAFLKCAVDEVPTAGRLDHLGLDSIGINALTDQLRTRLDLDLPATILFELPSLTGVVDYLVTEFGDELRRSAVLGLPGGEPVARAETGVAAPRLEFGSRAETRPAAALERPDDVAVIGLGGLFPGADNVHEFWRRICAGHDLITEMPEGRRRSVYQVYRDSLRELGGVHGGFVEEADRFDAAFFGLGEPEVMAMDPQQRLFLEAAWASIEDAGYHPPALSGQKVGVYVGAIVNEYSAYLADIGYPVSLVHEGTGSSLAGIANRVSYVLNVNGPSQAIDTACCSSLYALDRAVTDLRSGACDAALAGGVSFIGIASGYQMYAAMKYLAKDWRCKAFAAGGDGWAKAEVFASVYLKRHADAVRDGDPIYGVIKATGTNHGGRGYFYTQPNSPKHVELVRDVYRRADLDPAALVHIEAHGSGTEMGDVLEFNSLSRALQGYAAEKGVTLAPNRCGIGSVKSNLGHAEAGSGIVGFIKTVLLLHTARLPASLHLDPVNPHLRENGSPLFLVRQAQALAPRGTNGAPRCASVHSFNFSGATAHALVAEHVAPAATRTLGVTRYPICLSAKTPTALAAYRRKLAAFVRDEANAGLSLDALAFTLLHSRSQFEHRWGATVGSRAELAALLDSETAAVRPKTYRGVAGRISGRTGERPGLNDASVDVHLQRWVEDAAFDWATVLRGVSLQKINLPTYPFDHSTSYFPVAGSAVKLAPAPAAITTPTASLASAGDEPVIASSRVAPDRRGETEAAQLVEILAEVLAMPAADIDLERPVSDYGFDSAKIVALTEALNARFGLELKPPDLFEFTRPAELAAFVRAARPAVALNAPDAAVAAEPAREPAPSTREGIAIIGMAGQFPGATDLEEFWANLVTGKDAIAEIPPDRWDWRRFAGDAQREENKTEVRWGGFIADVTSFDPLFFGISPREAEWMDPQQRLLMMYAWRAIEDAGYAPSSLAGTDTGLFLATGGSQYSLRVVGATEGFSATGAIPSLGPNRISHFLDLHGPSEPVETSCSSALVAVHRAAAAIRSGECGVALAGGVNTIVTPDEHISFSKAGMLAKDGRCKTFSAEADGYGRGEGVGVVVLKSLVAAERDGDQIYGVMRGSAVNHGGRAPSLTAPNPRAQAELLKAAYTQAGVDPQTVGYIEAHGTGTPLGDPIEINGLKTAFRELSAANRDARPAAAHCGLGSVKTNIGHLELAAGAAGLIKVLLQLRHRMLVKSLHCARVNPYVELTGSPFYLLPENRAWVAPVDARGRTLPRRAGVSSFGFGGVNAHVVVEEYCGPLGSVSPTANSGPQLILLSARNEARLRDAASNLQGHLARHPALRLVDVAFTLQVGRDAMAERLAFVAESIDDARTRLGQFVATGAAGAESRHGRVSGSRSPHDDDPAPLSDGARSELLQLAERWVSGGVIDWKGRWSARPARRISLPTYPFARERCWLETLPPAAEDSGATMDPGTTFLARWETATLAGAEPAVMLPAPGRWLLAHAGPASGAVAALMRRCAEVWPAAAGTCVELNEAEDLENRVHGQLPADVVFYVGGEDPLDLHQPHRDHLLLLRLAKALKRGLAAAAAVDFFVVTVDKFRLCDAAANPAGAGLTGLAYAIAQADHRFRVRNIDLDHEDLAAPGSTAALIDGVLGEPASDRGEVIKLHAGTRYRRSLFPLAGASASERELPGFRRGGRYVILGGAGRVGQMVTRLLRERHDAHVVWIGRRAVTDATVRAQLAAAAAVPGRVDYVQGDVLAAGSVAAAVTQIKREFGPIHGAIFAGAVFSFENGFAETTEREFLDILDVKTRGSANFFAALRGEALDFLCYFSSAQSFSFSGAANLSAYAAGITFTDAWVAASQASAPFPVGAINWGFWETEPGGPDAAGHVGMLDAATGFAGLERFVGLLRARVLQQLVALRAPERVRAMMPLSDGTASIAAAAAAPGMMVSLGDGVRTWPVPVPSKLAEEFDRWILRLLSLQQTGLAASAGSFAPSEALAKWHRETRRLLAEHRVAGESGATVSSVWAEWDRWRADCGAGSSLQAQIELADACLRAVPEIMTGAVRPTEILFPNGAMERVERVYRDNGEFDFFNNVVAAVVSSAVARAVAANPAVRVRILEIGAGTGGTTAPVLRQLDNLAAHLALYRYTDVSRAFLLHGERTFAAGRPFVAFGVLDIERAEALDAADLGSFDIVIAANVLHATTSIRRTLRHAKAALKRDGLLVLNELAGPSLFAHTTFGLLDGWWRCDDDALRIPGSPGLFPETWGAVLREVGFSSVVFPAQHAHGLGQQVVVAASDGVIFRSRAERAPQVPAGQDGAVPAVARSKPVTTTDVGADVERVLFRVLSQLVKIPETQLQRDVPFSDYGVDSILGVNFVTKLGDELGLALNSAVLFEYATIDRLTGYLRTRSAAPAPAQVRAALAATREPMASSSASPAMAPHEAGRENEAVPGASRGFEEIAVIGMAGQFPGATSLAGFWQNLWAGKTCTGELPAHYRDGGGEGASPRGGALEERACFDPLFFNVSPREAESMTPHQRLILQESWKALEDAGLNPRALAGQPVGLFVGAEPSGYEHETFTGASDAIIASRLSYFLNLKGPALVVNTGCSSSATAIHLACESLAAGSASLALAGGVFATMNEAMLRPLARMGMLSPTGTCRPFDAAADGTVFAEGVGVVVLKRLRDALADGDLIHGVIEASGMNQDGASNGITAPNGEAQEQLVAGLYRRFAIDPETIGYIEAHGTGTRLGDPVEANALVRAFRQFTAKANFCALGSVKSAIGHTSAASGVISLIKVLLMFQHGKRPPLANFTTLNPLIELAGSPFRIEATSADWSGGGDAAMARRAAINSFGHSGTNVHLVVRAPTAPRPPAPAAGPQLVVLSAREEPRLRATVAQLADFLETKVTSDFTGVAHTLQVGREAMRERLAFIARDGDDLRAQLRAWLVAGETTPTCWRGSVDGAGSGVARLLQSEDDSRELAGRWIERGQWDKLAELWCLGGAIDWTRLHAGAQPARVRLPTYPFAKESYWAPAGAARTERAADVSSLPRTAVTDGVVCFEETWAARPPPTAVAPTPAMASVLCLVSDPQRQAAVREEIVARDALARVFFVSRGEAAMNAADVFRRVQTAAGNIDVVLCFWAVEERELRSDATMPMMLLQELRAAGMRPRRVVLAGEFASDVERCHLESWIGLERSVGFVWPDVRVAVLLAEAAPDTAETAFGVTWIGRCRELLGDPAGTSLRCERAGWRSLRRREVCLPAPRLSSLRGKTVLLTGGAGAVAAHLATRLAERGVGRLVLTGRSTRSAAIDDLLRTLATRGCAARYVQADVTDVSAMRNGLGALRANDALGPIQGVVHAAGAKDERSLFDKSAADARAILAPKIAGALALDEVLADEPLEFVVYVSSIAAALGDFGAADYAIGNRFLLAHAAQRNVHAAAGQRRGRAVAVAWGAWAGTGMGADTAAGGDVFLKTSGQRGLRIEEALDSFERSLALETSHVFVVAGESERTRKVLGLTPGAEAGDAESCLRAELRFRLAAMLKLAPDRVGEQQNFADFGLDSVNLIDWARELSGAYGLELTPATFFGHSTIQTLAQYLLTQPGFVRLAPSQPIAGASAGPAAATKPVAPTAVPVMDSGTLEPIAIIGSSGRFAGARTVEEMWRILAEGRSAVGEVPAERFTDGQSASNARCGFVPGVAEFDAAFFEISPLEAETMDPRQRLLLQEGWNALEDAGYGSAQLAGQRIGMFVGAEEGDYQQRVKEGSITSNHGAVLASRLAYFLDLKGPVLAINTSCSSSLVALHQACVSLRNDECDAALVAGVNLITARETFAGLSEAGMLSPDGVCRAFDRRANGMVPGEAVAVLVIKRLGRAVADRDAIHAVVAASGINYDGKTNGITAPNGVAQAALLKDVYVRAGIDPTEVGLVLTHGTGTRLGDPVEVNALREVFAPGAARRAAPAVLVSCKPNLGHAFAASGLVSVIALVQALQRATLPGSVHFDERNEFVRWDGSGLVVNRAATAWPAAPGHARTGAVSSFGMSGTNAHVILREAPAGVVRGPEAVAPTGSESEASAVHLLAWSAAEPEALRERGRQLAEYLRSGALTDAKLPALSATLLLGRHPLRYRSALVARSVAEAIRVLEGMLGGRVHDRTDLGGAARIAATAADRTEFAALLAEAAKAARIGDAARRRELLEAIGARFCAGHDPDWAILFDGPRPVPLRLPTYPFMRREYWLPTLTSPPTVGGGAAAGTINDFTARLRIPDFAAVRAASGPGSLDEQMELRASAVLGAMLAELGLFTPAGTEKTLAEISGGRSVPAYLERWVEQSRRMLAGIGTTPENVPSLPAAWQAWLDAKGSWAGNEAFVAREQLLETGFRGLPDILRGQRRVTEVLFPDSSLEMVERVYRFDAVGAMFNEAMASAVLSWIETRLAAEPTASLRILEIGAGTGGTTAALLPRLQGHREKIAEYVYTDVSKTFLEHAQGRYVPAYPFVRPRLLDVSRPAVTQGFAAGRFDLVIAANVLHATTDVRVATRNAKSMLRPGGAMFLNEISTSGWFTHFPFGLLEGWWLYTDPELRLPGCPGLAPATWLRVLTEEGFGPVLFPAAEGHPLGQQLIVAVSDGRIAPEFAGDQAAVQTAPSPAPAAAKWTGLPVATPVGGADGDGRMRCTEFFRELIARTLKMEPREIDSSEALESYGVDSLTIGKVLTRMRAIFTDVPSTLLFETRTVAELANHFWENRRSDVLAALGERAVAGGPTVVARATLSASVATSPSGPATTVPVVPATVARAAEPFGSPPAVPEPIAIIGMTGRYPAAPDLATFWANLCAGKDCIGEIPPDRWAIDGFYEADPERAIEEGKSYTKWGAFLEGFSEFDPLFFKIAPREALHMDPQERLFVQAAWAVLEDAGYTPKSLVAQTAGRVGVFTGITHTDYNIYGPERWGKNERLYPRTSFSSVPNRVSYLFNFNGPSLPFDTMCSSSLTALHAACESILRGECAVAVAGATNLSLHPSSYIALCAARMLSKERRCHAFGIGEDGFVPGEGVGALLLKRLSEAERDGDQIHAVIRGTAVNHGGRTNGYTVPDPQSQGRVVREALDRAGLSARTISYIEAHGTGTKLGDPIEVAGLTRCFRQDTAENAFCAIGSVKSNVGHLEAAAGLVGLTKVVLAMKHGQLPASLHAEVLNPEIDFPNTPFVVQRTLAPWARPTINVDGVAQACPRRAGISSFGAGGSNAHVVVEEYIDRRPGAPGATGPVVVVLSARDAERLKEAVRRLLNFVRVTPAVALGDLAYTLQLGREAMDERLGVVVSSRAELEKALQSQLDGGSGDGVRRGNARADVDAAGPILESDELADLVPKLVERRRFPRLLELWVRGCAVDWSLLHGGVDSPRRVSLPGYPFAPERYWFSDVASTTAVAPPVEQAMRPTMTAAPAAAANLSWVFLREHWETQPFPEQLEAKLRLQQQAGKRVGIVAGDAAEAGELAALIRRLAGTAELSRDLEIEVLGPADEFTANSAPSVVFCLGPQVAAATSSGDVGDEVKLAYATSQKLMNACWGEPVAIYYLYGAAATSPRSGCEALSGFVRAAMKENEQHVWTLIRHDERHSAQSRLQVLLKEWLFAPMPRDGAFAGADVRHLGEERQVKVLGETPLPEVAAPVFRDRGVYLLAGGFGYLGQQLSLALAQRHQATLVLWSRGALDAERRAHCRQLEALGAAVICDTVDVTDEAGVEQAYRKLKSEVNVIHGVFHLARRHDDRMIARKPWSSFHQVVQTKVAGTRHLDRVTQDEPLDFFAMFSSLGAYGVRGGSDYSFATAFQNAFSGERARLVKEGARRGATVAFCWGPWLEDRVFPKSRGTLTEAGFGLIGIEHGFPLIERALAAAITPLAIVAMQDATKVRRILGLEAGAPATTAEAPPAARADAPADLERELVRWEALRAQGADVRGALSARISEGDLAHLPEHQVNRVYHLLFGANGESETEPAARKVTLAPPAAPASASAPATTTEALAGLLRIVFQDVLQLPAIQDGRTFQDYGMDSISGMQAAVRLEKQLKREVPPQWLINFPTIAALSKHLFAEKFTLPSGDAP